MLFRRPLSLLGVLLRETVGVGLTRALVTRAGCAPSVPRRCRIRPAVLTAPGPRRRARGGRGGGLSAVRAILLAGAVRRAARTGGVLATPGLGIDPVRLGETLIDSITLLVDRGPLFVRLGLTPLSSDLLLLGLRGLVLGIQARAVGLELGLRSEEHTSELQSRGHLVCRLL